MKPYASGTRSSLRRSPSRFSVADPHRVRPGIWTRCASRCAAQRCGCGEPFLDILLQNERDTGAAKRFFEKLIKDHIFVPQKIVTDQLGSYKAALDEIAALQHVKHVFVKSEARLNNRVERDHEHVREKQRSSRGVGRVQHDAPKLTPPF
ncbi:MAG: DDE-type integrase/transposase/recombinase [Pleurocapsa sp. SU_196_0]|nr:DDE-type integrase/transposase/recombinase [Pleurocapsa sp. SU_196_0]